MQWIGRRSSHARIVASIALVLLAAAGPAAHAQGQGKDVVVVNDASRPVPVHVVDRKAPTPWQREFSIDWADGVGFTTATYQVPPDKRLVIEFASFFAYLPPSGQTIFVRILTSASGSSAFHALSIPAAATYGVLKQFEAAQDVKIYADPGSTIQVSMGRSPFADTASGALTLSGHLVDAN